MSTDSAHRYAVVVAGGSGTRLWPLSRHSLPKQMQSLMSDRTLIAETVARLQGVVPAERILVSTTDNYREAMAELLPDVPAANFVVEPEARGPLAAFALLAQHLHRRDPDAVVFTLASDHAVTGVGRFQETMRIAYDFIETHPAWLAIVGVVPTRPDTTLGYIRAAEAVQDDPLVRRVDKYAEKPSLATARDYLRSGRHYWNSAYYCFRADTLVAAYRAADPVLVEATGAYLDTGDPADYRRAPDAGHEIDVLDPTAIPLALVPADFAWSDIGTWAALHRALSEAAGGDVVVADLDRHVDEGSSHALVLNQDSRVVATAGLDHIAVVTTGETVFVVDLRRIESAPEMMQRLFDKLREKGQQDLL